jgi:hypothetical protein
MSTPLLPTALRRPFTLIVLALAGLSWLLWHPQQGAAESATPPVPTPSQATASDVAALKAEIERMKTLLPDQSHAMKDVGYHFANLWFAGQHKNWPLAEFYWSETRSHLRWAVRIIPVRKDLEGREIHLTELLAGIEAAAMEPLHATIKDKSTEKFPEAYRQMMSSCYACHLAVGKPFLTLQVPTQPEAPIIQFEPVQ